MLLQHVYHYTHHAITTQEGRDTVLLTNVWDFGQDFGPIERLIENRFQVHIWVCFGLT